jgi:hypothetical protein
MKKAKSVYVRKFLAAGYLVASLVLLAAILMPLLTGQASAVGQITNRSLTISSGVPSQTNVTYTFSFTIPSTSQVQGIKFIACTTAVGTYPNGTCTPPTGMTNPGDGFSNAAFVSQSGWQGATNFAIDGTGANDCTPAPNVFCVNRTDTTAQTATARSIVFNTIKNPSVANTAFFVGIETFTTVNYTHASLVDAGTTASAVVQTLTTNAAVAEVLNFCVGSTAIDDTYTSPASDCSAISGTSVDIGTLDTSTVNISPVTVNGGDSNNGIAMLRTNALNGTTISYDAIQQSGTNHLGTLRISGSTCNAVTNNFIDPCINAAGGTQTPFTAGSEAFGMTIAGVNSGSVTSYTCQYGDTTAGSPVPAGNSCNLKPSVNYLGKGTSGSTEDFGTSNGFAWVETGAATQIASSTSAVDDESLILKFAATPSITTPFGRYAAQSDYIAVPTY